MAPASSGTPNGLVSLREALLRPCAYFTGADIESKIGFVSGQAPYNPAPMLPPPPPAPPRYPPAPLSPEDERLWGMLAYLLSILVGIWAPLIIYLVFKDRSAFVRDVSKESLNLHITALGISLAAMFGIGGFAFIMLIAFPPLAIMAFFLWIAVAVGYGVAVLIFNIIGAMKANSGFVYRVPCILRLVK